jgi:hypothetical protein
LKQRENSASSILIHRIGQNHDFHLSIFCKKNWQNKKIIWPHPDKSYNGHSHIWTRTRTIIPFDLLARHLSLLSIFTVWLHTLSNARFDIAQAFSGKWHDYCWPSPQAIQQIAGGYQL